MTWHDARSGRGACARKEEALRSAEGKRRVGRGEGSRIVAACVLVCGQEVLGAQHREYR